MAKKLTFGIVLLMMLAFVTAFFSLILLAFPYSTFKILGVLMFWGFVLMGITIISVDNIPSGTITSLYFLILTIIIIMAGLGMTIFW